MIDLTGANLVAYLLRVIKDVVNRNPRFKNTLGEVTYVSPTEIRFADTQVVVKSISSAGTRLSPDYFMCTHLGQALAAKVQNKEGSFIEWVTELNRSQMDPGVYYINIDTVVEKTREIGFTIHKYKWRQGKVQNAEGSKIYFRSGIDPSAQQYLDQDGNPLILGTDVIASTLAVAYLKKPVSLLSIVGLTPFTDYWYEHEHSFVLGTTVGGSQTMYIPQPYLNLVVKDQDGYELRDIDYSVLDDPQQIELGPWTPPGSVLTSVLTQKADPTTESPVNPENILNISPLVVESNGVQEALVDSQVFVQTADGTVSALTVQSDGTIMLPSLLGPGEWARWEVRIDCGQNKSFGLKNEMNAPVRYQAPAAWNINTVYDVGQLVQYNSKIYLSARSNTGIEPGLNDNWGEVDSTLSSSWIKTTEALIPGLWIAIGDMVIAQDQVAIIVSPTMTQTYEVYGSKDNLSFTLDIKSNDYMTSSELSEAIKRELLIMRRNNMEADGITIYEISRDSQGVQRDPSGTTMAYIYSLSVTAAADWKLFIPLVTRLVSVDVEVTTSTDFPGKLQFANRMQAFGVFKFLPGYA